MDKNSFKYWYKNSFDNIEAIPPDGVWNNITSNLDALQNQRRRKQLAYIIPFLISFAVGSLLTLSEQHIEKLYSPLSNSLEFDQDGSQDNLSFLYPKKKFRNSLKQEAKSYIKKDDLKPEKQELLNEHTQELATQTITKTPTKSYTNFKDIILENRLIYHIPIDINIVNPKELTSPVLAEKSTNIDSRFWIGGGYQFSSCMLLNSVFFQGLSENSLIVLETNFHHNYSFDGGIKLNEKWSLGAKVALSNTGGQHFSTYKEGSYITNEVHIKQSGVSFSLQRNLGKSIYFLKRKSPIHLSAGLFTSSISKVELIEKETNVSDLTADYTKFDFGAVFATGLTFPLSDWINIQPQAQASLGFNNLFKGNDIIPSGFNITRSLSISPGVNFQFEF